MEYKKINIRNLVNDIDSLLAHKNKSSTESLLEHSEQALRVFELINQRKNVLQAINEVINTINFKHEEEFCGSLSLYSKTLIIEMFTNAIYLHDIGKINLAFQFKHIKNKDVNYLIEKYKDILNLSSMETWHSFLSSSIFINIYYSQIKAMKNDANKLFLTYLMFAFAQIINNHHSPMENLYDKTKENRHFVENIKNCLSNGNYNVLYKKPLDLFKKDRSEKANSMCYVFEKTFENIQMLSFDEKSINIIVRLLQSCLIASDFIATYCFYNNEKIENIDLGVIDNIDELIDKFNENEIVKKIGDYRLSGKNPELFENCPINTLRSDMFIEVEENFLRNLNCYIYNLQAPTGSGKTITATNLSLKTIKKTNILKIIIAVPYNALSSQTNNTYKNLFGNKLEFQVINSLTSALERKYSSGEIDYDKTLLDRQLLSYPVVLTSNIKLFDILFGNKRLDAMPLFQLMNSIIVLDEIQAYNNTIWREIIEHLYKYAEILNIKFVIMSATLPNLQKLIGFKNEEFVDLIKNPKKYFEHELFKNRVKKDYSMLKCKIECPILKNKIIQAIKERNKTENYSKVLIGFIKKKSAKEFYKKYKDFFESKEFIVLEFTGDDNVYEKAKMIDIVNKTYNKNLILISTQAIEAGIDIDCDIGFKDYSLLDSDEQFCGRINRSAKKKNCIVYFFKMDSEEVIYKNDLRLKKTLKYKKYQEILTNVEFSKFYDEVLDKIKIKSNELNDKNGIKSHYSSIKLQNHRNIAKKMKLISNQTFSIFLPYKFNMQTFDNTGNLLSESLMDGEKIWGKFIKLTNNQSLSYAEKRINLMKIREFLNLFIFQIYGKELIGIDEISGIYYIRDGEKYIINNKFDREIFKQDYKSRILS